MPIIYDKAPCGKVYLDGTVSVDEESVSIKERKNIGSNGYIEATLLISASGNYLNKTIVTFRGLPVEHKEDFIYEF